VCHFLHIERFDLFLCAKSVFMVSEYVFENKIPNNIFWSKRGDISWEFRKLYKKHDDLHS
jgi:hypothetical protein